MSMYKTRGLVSAHTCDTAHTVNISVDVQNTGVVSAHTHRVQPVNININVQNMGVISYLHTHTVHMVNVNVTVQNMGVIICTYTQSMQIYQH